MKKIYVWFYKLIRPYFEKLEVMCQGEIHRIRRQEVLAAGMKLVKEFEEKRKKTQESAEAIAQRLYPHLKWDQIQKDKQANCSHLKGGRIRGYSRDYNIWMHRYVDNTFMVRCLNCRKSWWRHLTSDYEWKTVVIPMMESTTNTSTSSEVKLDYKLPNKKENENGPDTTSQKLS